MKHVAKSDILPQNLVYDNKKKKNRDKKHICCSLLKQLVVPGYNMQRNLSKYHTQTTNK